MAFDPAASGSRSATLNFSDNATSSPQQVSLTGTGTSSGPPPPPHPARGTCSGSFAVPGVLSGVHTGNVTVKGYCIVDGGPTVITGDLTLAKGAALNATFARNDVTGAGSSSLLVEGDLRVGTGAALDMGCEPKYSPCSDDPTVTIGPHGPAGGRSPARTGWTGAWSPGMLWGSSSTPVRSREASSSSEAAVG